MGGGGGGGRGREEEDDNVLRNTSFVYLVFAVIRKIVYKINTRGDDNVLRNTAFVYLVFAVIRKIVYKINTCVNQKYATCDSRDIWETTAFLWMRMTIVAFFFFFFFAFFSWILPSFSKQGEQKNQTITKQVSICT